MTNAVQKAHEAARGAAAAAASRALNLKRAGGLSLAPSEGLGQYGNYKDQAANQRRYSLFRGWVYDAVHALALEGAGQPVRVGRLRGAADAPAPAGRKHAATEMEILEDHPLLDSLEQPNDIQMRWQFVYSFIANLCLTGWSYIIRDTGDDGQLKFYSIPTTWVRPIHTKGPFAEFKIVNPRDPGADGKESPTFTRDQVGFAHFPDPSDPMGALAPAAAVQSSISIDEKIQQSQEAFFDNGIFPSVIITMGQQPHPSGDGQYRPRLTAEQRRQVYGAIRKVSGGIANYGNPAIIDGLIEKIERLSATQNEMGWEKSEKTVRSRILAAFGVHPYILGEEVAGSYAQAYNVQERFFRRVNTFLSLLGTLMTRLGREALDAPAKAAGKPGKPAGKSKVKVEYVPCKAVDPSMEKTTWEQARVRDDVTQNEFRAWMGLAPDEDQQEAVMNKTLAAPITAIAEKATSGALTPEQALAMLKALGLPEDVAKEIAGEGPPEPPAGMVSGGPGKPPVPDPTKLPPAPPGVVPPPGKPGAVPPGAPGKKPPQAAGPPKKPVGTGGAAAAAKKALQAAAAALRLEQPLDEEVREILELGEFIKGGAGSGNFGHGGRPGQVGGSGGGGAAPVTRVELEALRAADFRYDILARQYEEGDFNKQGWKAQGLTPYQAAALRNYTKEAFREVNGGLRNPPPGEHTATKARLINEGLGQMPDHKGVVYRGLLSARDWEPGFVLEEKGFSSTSVSERAVRDGFVGKTMLEIKSKSGKNIRNVSNYNDEDEILFKSGTRFKVTGKRPDGGITIYELEEV